MLELLNIDPYCLQGAILLFLAMAIGHSLADFPLQGLFLSEAKNRHVQLSQPTKTQSPHGLWIQGMSAHSLIHCGAVWLITGSAVLGIIEFFLHWIIDCAKSEKWIGFNTDQLLHYVSKMLYVALIYYQVVAI